MSIKWTQRALADLDHVFDYIAQDNPAAALSVIDRIETTIDHLSVHPKMGRSGRVNGTFELVILPTPYIVSYRIVSQHLEIIAVIHANRQWPDGF